MEPAVTPELALRYLRELSADLVAAAVLAPDGTRLAGPRALAAAAALLLARMPGVPLAQGTAGDADRLVVLARSREHVLVAVHTRWALPALVRHDLVTVLRDLAVGRPGGATADARPHALPGGDPALTAVARAADGGDHVDRRGPARIPPDLQ